MTNANKFNLLLDVAKLMHSLADGLEAVAYRHKYVSVCGFPVQT